MSSPTSPPQEPISTFQTDESAAAPPDQPAPHLRPDHREMYLLIAGLIVGLILSPHLLGRLLGESDKQAWYFNARADFDALDAFDQETLQRIEQRRMEIQERSKADLSILHEATPIAMEEFKLQITRDLNGVQAAVTEERQPSREPLLKALAAAQGEHLDWTRRAMFALMLATALLMFLEPLFEPVGPLAGVRRRMATLRYLVAATWIAWLLAQPYGMDMPSLLWPLIIAALVVGAAVLPWIAGEAEKEPA